MLKKFAFLSVYKVPLLLSLTLGIALIALRVSEKPLEIAGIFLGVTLGTFFLDLEYFLIAYVFEPESEFSKSLKGFIKHGDIFNAARHIQLHKDLIKDKSLSSVLFQVVLAVAGIVVVFSQTPLFVQALILSVLAHSIYSFFEHFFDNKVDEWFWELKTKPTREGVFFYSLLMVVIFVFCVYNF